MSIWDDPDFTAEVVRRYVAGEGTDELAKSLGLTRKQVGSKLDRLGVLRAPEKATRPRQKRRESGAYGNMASRAAIIDRARRCFRSGPRTVDDISVMLEVDSHAAASVVRRLLDLREIDVQSRRGRVATYRLIAPPAPRVRGIDLRRLEDAYVQARRNGGTARDLAQSMGLTQTAAENFEGSFRAQTTSANNLDNSCPKFAHHDLHLKALAGAGRYPVMSKRTPPPRESERSSSLSSQRVNG